jgi:hypothetical protein
MYVPDSSSEVREGSGWLQLAMRPDLLTSPLGMPEHHLLASIANRSSCYNGTTSHSLEHFNPEFKWHAIQLATFPQFSHK